MGESEKKESKENGDMKQDNEFVEMLETISGRAGMAFFQLAVGILLLMNIITVYVKGPGSVFLFNPIITAVVIVIQFVFVALMFYLFGRNVGYLIVLKEMLRASMNG